MSVKRVTRFFVGLIIASLILGFGLPLIGIPSSKFLPPPIIYSHAEGKTMGAITGKTVAPTANPFDVGNHVWTIEYQFQAPPPLKRGEIQPGPKQVYTGSVRVDEAIFDAAQVGTTFYYVKYEKTNPDINGLYMPKYPEAMSFGDGRSIGPGSNILSGWILFVLLDLLLAYLFMSFVLERFGTKEDI